MRAWRFVPALERHQQEGAPPCRTTTSTITVVAVTRSSARVRRRTDGQPVSSCLRRGPAGTAEDPVRDVAIRSQPRRHDSQQQRGLDERHVRHLPGRRVGVLLRDSQPASDAGLQVHARWRALDAGRRSRSSPPTSIIRSTRDAIHFPAAVNRFRHGYDNFQVDRTKLAQDGVPRNTREDILYDVIIIGSGMGGGSLADAPVRRRHQDAGARGRRADPADAHDEPARRLVEDGQPSPVGHFVNEPGSDFLPGVHLSLGGRSVYWSGLIPRMHDWELSFWPEPVRNFLKQGGYEPAETLLRKTRRLGPFQDQVVATLKADLPDWQVEDLPRSVHQPFLNDAGELGEHRSGFHRHLLHRGFAAEFDGVCRTRQADSNLTINLGHLVTHIATNGTKATDVVCQDLLGNTTRRYRGRFIVLAAGSLESPRIAMNSGLSDPSGQLGVGLTDHPAFFSAAVQHPEWQSVRRLEATREGLSVQEDGDLPGSSVQRRSRRQSRALAGAQLGRRSRSRPEPVEDQDDVQRSRACSTTPTGCRHRASAGSCR